MSTPPPPLSAAASSESVDWFAREVGPHDGQLKAWLRGKFPAVRHEVDDVVQESYLRIWKRQAVSPIASVKAFLFTAARNVAIDLLRRHQRSRVDSLEALSSLETSSVIMDEAPNAAETLTIQERYDLLVEAVSKLAPRCREVVLWHKFRGLTQREVAVRLGISERTVEVHVRTAVAQCEAYLRARGVTTLKE
ncbi:MAG: RNA polymerase sigma factor [Lacunisphaera sp.]